MNACMQIINRTARQLQCIVGASVTSLLPALILIVTIESSFAASGTWLATPFNGDWNFVGIEASNWTDNNGNFVVPNGSADTATFGFSNITDVFISENTEVNSIIFTAPAPNPYTITASSGLTLTISGVGITNNSGQTQTFETSFWGSIKFTNSATAGNLTRFMNDFGGTLSFLDNSTAGNATIINSN